MMVVSGQVCRTTLQNNNIVNVSASTCSECFCECNTNPLCQAYSWNEQRSKLWSDNTLCTSEPTSTTCIHTSFNMADTTVQANGCMDCFYKCNNDPQCMNYRWGDSQSVYWSDEDFCTRDPLKIAECYQQFLNNTMDVSLYNCYDCFISCNNNPDCYAYRWNDSQLLLWSNDALCYAVVHRAGFEPAMG